LEGELAQNVDTVLFGALIFQNVLELHVSIIFIEQVNLYHLSIFNIDERMVEAPLEIRSIVHHTILIYGVGWLISIVPEKDRVFTK
jgi:hypothetical protein